MIVSVLTVAIPMVVLAAAVTVRLIVFLALRAVSTINSTLRQLGPGQSGRYHQQINVRVLRENEL